MARWTGPIFLLIGLAWLAMIPFTSGIQTIRWILGVSFVICGLTGWISYFRNLGASAYEKRTGAPEVSCPSGVE